MRGWLIVNGFLQSEKFAELYACLKEAANGENVKLEVRTSQQVFALQRADLYGRKKPDFVVFWDKDYPLAKRLEQLGLRMFNGADAMHASDDKMLTALALQGRVATPRTLFAPMTFEGVGYSDFAFLDTAEEQLSYPMVVKESVGSFGQQVYLAHDRGELEEIVGRMGSKPFLLQEFIAESAGRDARINVVGGKVVCAMLRENGRDFRSNVTGGGTATAYTPTEAEAEAAIAACRALGLDYAGVDVLFGKDGPLVCEVNSNPHFKSTLDCTGVNMGVEIMRHVIKIVRAEKPFKPKYADEKDRAKRGWLIYDEEGAKRNWWFIKECLCAAKAFGLELTLKIYEGNGVLEEKDFPDFAVVRTIEPKLTAWLNKKGVRTFNNYKTSFYANDKWSMHQLAEEMGLPVMPTKLATQEDISPYGYPVVMKHRSGHGGKQVYCVDDEETYVRRMSEVNTDDYIVQEMCSRVGRDVRLYMLGGRVIAAVLRISYIDFRSNFSLGGKAKLIAPPAEAVKIAQKLYKKLHCDFVGVDFIPHEGRWILNEVEDVVGSRMLYENTMLDIAMMYFQHIANELQENKK